MAEWGLFIGEVARRADVTVKTIRYYERIGLLPPSARNAGNLRVFDPETVQRLGFIRRAKSLGFSLLEIDEIISVHDQGRCTCGRVRQTIRRKLGEIEAKLGELRAMRQTLLRVEKKLPPAESAVSESICPAIHESAPAG